jgi:hypothetical protein
MGRVMILFVCAVATIASPMSAQTGAKKTPEQMQAAFNAHKGDFDYLLGDWQFVANNKQYGKSNGRWSAVRTATGQILDEYRLVDEKGATFYVTATIRNYNAVKDQWELIGMDDRNGLQDFGTGQKVALEMHIEQRFGVAGGTPNTLRIRYYNIKADSFSWTADQSTDGGKTWVKDFIQIEAKRVGPPRALPPLAATK